MKSIKRGRGPSLLSGIMGIFMIFVGIVWTALAAQASTVMALFGVLWTLMAVVTTIYHLFAAIRSSRPSVYDITEDNEEPDPLNTRFGKQADGAPANTQNTAEGSGFCPYCGAKAEKDYSYCRRCGKKLP